MTLDKQIIQERLARLEHIVQKLEDEKPRSIEQLASNDTLSDATLYRLQTGIEAIVDIGNHILTEAYDHRSETYKDTLIELGKAGVIPKKFIEENVTMTGFRNLVVHQYGEINLEKVYAYLGKAPSVFREFAQHFTSFLEKQK